MLALILLVAVLIGVAGGILSWLGGLKPTQAILAGSGAFAAATLLGLAIVQFAEA